MTASVAAEPVYSDRDSYLLQQRYGIEAELDKPAENYKQSRNTAASTGSAFELEAEFVCASSWLSGINWGGVTFNGSLSKGADFFGSSLTDADLVPVEIIFSNTDSTLCQTFRRDLGYASAGVGVFPGTAWDMSDTTNPRQLNICFVEDAAQGAVNQIWDPNSTSAGKREYIFIMLSDYDGTGTTYAGQNVNSGGSLMDVVYGYWPLITPGFSLLQDLPASLLINLYFVNNLRAIPDSTQNILTWTFSEPNIDFYNVYAGSADPPSFLTTVAGTDNSFIHTSLSFGTEYFYRVEAVNLSSDVFTSKTISSTTQKPYQNMNLVGYLHEHARYGDIWGYTFGETEYALICARDEGVAIVDITATPPVEVGFINSVNPQIDTKDVKIYQNYAVVVNESDVIQIVDISNVTAPVQVGTFTPDGGGSHNCLIEGDYLYIIGNHGTGGLEIVDISNPAAPVEVGQFQPFYYHDIDIRNDTVCATGIYGDGIDLIDVSNKAAPSLISRFNYTGSGAHNAEFSSDGSHVFIGDEIGSSGNHTRVFNITDPFNVSLASEIIIDPNAAMHNCYVIQDTLLVMGHYTLGVRVSNISDPTNPVEIAHYDTFLKNEYGYQGCWSVYPYFASGKIVASDMQTGLYVFELDSPPPTSCCFDVRGNVDNTPDPDVAGVIGVDIADLVYLVAFSFGGGPAPVCTEEGDLDGSGGALPIDIADIVYLVDFMFGGGPAPVACP